MPITLECISTPSTDTFTPLSYLSDGNTGTYLSSVSTRTAEATGSYPFTLRLTETFSPVVDVTSIFVDCSVLFSQLDGVFGTTMTYPWDTSATVQITVTNNIGSYTTNVTGTYPDYSDTIALSYSSVSSIVVDIVVGAVRNAGTPPLQNETCRPEGTYIRLRGYTSSTAESGGGGSSSVTTPLWTHDAPVTCGWVIDPALTCGWVADTTLPCTITTTSDLVYWDFSMTTLVDFSMTTEASTFDSTNTGADN